eukprot:XP_001700163.1 transient receptor potential ion channel protein [Chlamydomonas reinhardtii]
MLPGQISGPESGGNGSSAGTRPTGDGIAVAVGVGSSTERPATPFMSGPSAHLPPPPLASLAMPPPPILRVSLAGGMAGSTSGGGSPAAPAALGAGSGGGGNSSPSGRGFAPSPSGRGFLMPGPSGRVSHAGVGNSPSGLGLAASPSGGWTSSANGVGVIGAGGMGGRISNGGNGLGIGATEAAVAPVVMATAEAVEALGGAGAGDVSAATPSSMTGVTPLLSRGRGWPAGDDRIAGALPQTTEGLGIGNDASSSGIPSPAPSTGGGPGVGGGAISGRHWISGAAARLSTGSGGGTSAGWLGGASVASATGNELPSGSSIDISSMARLDSDVGPPEARGMDPPTPSALAAAAPSSAAPALTQLPFPSAGLIVTAAMAAAGVSQSGDSAVTLARQLGVGGHEEDGAAVAPSADSTTALLGMEASTIARHLGIAAAAGQRPMTSPTALFGEASPASLPMPSAARAASAAGPPQGLEYQTILRIHQRAILCGAVRNGGEDGYVLWDLGRGRPLLMSLEESGPWAAASAAATPPPFGPAPPPPAAAAATLDNDLERRSSVNVAVPSAAPTRPPPTNMAAFKQYLSLRRPGVPTTAAAAAADTDSDTDDENADDPLRRARKAARLAAAGAYADAATAAGALPNGKSPPQAANMLKERTMQRPGGAKAGRPGFGANGPPSAGLPGMLHSSGEESGGEGGEEDGAAAAWQGASYRNMITAVAFVSDYSWATCHPGGAIRVWRANTHSGPTRGNVWDGGKRDYTSAFLERTLTGHTGYINNIASYCGEAYGDVFEHGETLRLEGGRLAVTTGLDTTARSWDLTEGRQIACFTEHENEVTAVAVMDSGKMALTTAEVVPEVASAMLWDPKTGKLFHTLVGHHGWLHGVALSERRKIAVAVGEHATLFIWNTETGNLLLSKRVASDGVQRWASINSDGNFLCFGSAEGVVRVVETYYGCELARFDSTWVDNEFHSISACFFCDDELHDDPEHWNNKFLSLKSDGQDVSTAHVVGAVAGPVVTMCDVPILSNGQLGTDSSAAIGRAAAAGAMSDDGHSDFDDELLIDEDDPDLLPDTEPTANGAGGGDRAAALARARQSGGGAPPNAASAASTSMFTFGNLRSRIGGGTGDSASNNTSNGAEPSSPGAGNYKSMGLKASLERVNTANKVKRLPATQPKAKEPAAGGKAARFALPADADDEPSQPSVDGANSNGGGSDADTLATAASPLSRTRFAPNAALPSANSDSDKDAGAKRASSVAPSPPGAASNGLLGPPSTLPSVAAHLPSQPMRPFAKINDATELEMSPFGRRIVSLSGDGTVRVWSLLGVSVRRELPRHPEMVNEVAISRDRSLVVTVTENEGCLRAFSLSTGHLVTTVPAHVSYDPYTRDYELEGTAVTCSDDTTIKIWDLSKKGGPACVRILYGHAGGVTGVCWVPGSSRVLSVGEDRSVLEWEAGPAGGSAPVARMDHVHEDAIIAVVTSHDGRRALTCSMDRTARLVIHGAFSPDGRHIVTCGADCTVRVWDADNGKQLMCFEGHSRTVTRCLYLNSYVVATASRDGTIRCWDVQRKRRLPSVAPPFALEADSFEAMVLLPSQRCGYGFPEVLASLTSGRVVVYDPTYRQPLPEQLLLQLNPDLELLGPPDDLVVDFPGLLVMPIRDGNTMLHMAAMSGDFVLLRALLAGIAGSAAAGGSGGGPSRSQANDAAAANGYGYYGFAPPLPLNFVGQTPLDLAAWNMLAEEMPTLLVTFLKALSLDPVTGLEEDVLFAPMRAADEVMTQGAEDLAAADLWLDHVNQLREDLERLPWYAHVWPLRHWMRDYREKPTRPSIAGLPYVALSARNMEHSPLGVLVQHGLSQALASDVMYAVLFYKWESFARTIFMKESLVFIAFLALYLVASTMSVLQSPHVRFEELYDMSRWQNIIRVVLEAVVALMALHDIYGEVTEVVNAGWYMYLTGSQGSWNGIEMSSCIGILLAFGLQLGSFEGGSRFMMSLTTILLGLRLLKVASGPEHTGVFVQALLRIVANLRFFILILVVLVLTFSFAFWQIMSIDLPQNEDHRDGQDFDTLGNTIVQAYALGVIGQMDGNIGQDFAWRPWVQVLALTYTFLVTVILLNLLVAVMSDTYSVVKEHARSEWLLLRAKLILEIESSLPDGFFKDTQRSCPRWLHCLKVDSSGGRRGDESLIESMRGPIARNVLNTDLKQTESRLVDELHDVRDTLRLLHADVGTLRTALAAGGVSLPVGGASANPIYAPLGVGGTSQRFGSSTVGGGGGGGTLAGLFGGGPAGGNGPGSAAMPAWSSSGGVGSAAVGFNARLQSPPVVRLTSLSSERGLRIGSTSTSRHSLFDRDSRKHLY